MSKHLLSIIFAVVFLFNCEMANAQSVPSNGSTSLDLVADELKVFPNPTTDYFQISNGSNIKKIVVYNIFGKEVKTFFHYNNAQHEVSDIKSGMYIVKMIDEKNKVIKSVKLHKNFTGA
jgi:hypothetical protein